MSLNRNFFLDSPYVSSNVFKKVLVALSNTKNLFPLNLSRANTNYLFAFLDSHVIHYPTPITLTYSWSFGSLAGICLVIQMISGIFLAMHYTPNIELAFSSIEYIMRDIPNGWLIRYIHGAGAQRTKRFVKRSRKKVVSFRKASMYLKLEEFNLGSLCAQRRLDLSQLPMTSCVWEQGSHRLFIMICDLGKGILSNKLIRDKLLFLFVLEAHQKFR